MTAAILVTTAVAIVAFPTAFATAQTVGSITHECGREKPPPIPDGARARATRPATMLRALLIADTKAKKIGRSVEKDLETMSALLRAAAESDPCLVTLTTLAGDDATPEKVFEYLNALPADLSGETLLVYHSGHGSWTVEHGVYLCLGRRGLHGRDIHNYFAARKPQLGVLIADCCSSASKGDRKKRWLPLLIKHGGKADGPGGKGDVLEALNQARFRQLFLEQRGVVEITASQPGKDAYCNDEIGGYLTHALAKSLTLGDTVIVENLRVRFERGPSNLPVEVAERKDGRTELRLTPDRVDGLVRWDDYFHVVVKPHTVEASGYAQVPRLRWELPAPAAAAAPPTSRRLPPVGEKGGAEKLNLRSRENGLIRALPP